MKPGNIIVAIAGQPNCGKSTVFNALTGASQHVANYPGVTVDKKIGWYRHNNTRYEVVDLPGTYSLSSYSPEERVSRDFIIHEKPAVVVNVTDASNLKRSLYLTVQLLEMERPVVMNLNMIDVVENRKTAIDFEKLEKRLGVRVVPTAMKTGRGKQDLKQAVDELAARENDSPPPPPTRYGVMETCFEDISERLLKSTNLAAQYPLRWLAIKLMEGDLEIRRIVESHHPAPEKYLKHVDSLRHFFEETQKTAPEVFIAQARYAITDEIAKLCIVQTDMGKRTMTDKIDGIVCHRFLGPVILVGVIWLLYYLAIGQGYNITNYTWPLLARVRSLAEWALPAPGFIDIPLLRSFVLWFVDSVNALLNYIPIFFILFALIAILEDSGYMPRMAFIMDRLFSAYGLHGQSTLPMVLGGIYVGGCAVPGVMACKGIPDERSRLATILVIPLLNCLAKVPLYVLLINIYFASNKGLAMFFISTISLLMVLPISKILTMTVLKDKETAPFVMEMPPYHLPAIRGVLSRALERVWLFVRKITTIVATVAIIIFILLQFPGITKDRAARYEAEKNKAIAGFQNMIEGTPWAGTGNGPELMALITYWDAYKAGKMRTRNKEAVAALNEKYRGENPDFFKVVQPGADKQAKKVNRALNTLIKTRKHLLRQMRAERIDNSFLGRLGKLIDPVTKYAGFDWRVNVALLSALAAKESSVATLGALYQPDESGAENQTLEERMARDSGGFTPLHGLALMLFMVLYPPCLATTIAVKIQTGSYKWMIFSMVYPMALGLTVAVLVFTGGLALGLTGFEAMFIFYGLALLAAIVTGKMKMSHASSRSQTEERP